MQVNTREFNGALQKGSAFAGTVKTLPILDCVKITFKGDIVRFSSSDNENTISISLRLDGVSEYDEKSICVNAKDLANYVKLIDDMFFDILINENDITIKHSGGKYTLPLEDADSFPAVTKEEYKTIEVDAKELVDYLKYAKPFVASDELRPVMCGICFDIRNGVLTNCATDAQSLFTHTFKTKYDIEDTTTIMNGNSVKGVCALLSGCTKASIKIGNRTSIIQTDNGSICYRHIEGRYPNFGSVIPKNNAIKVEFDIKKAMKAINMASLSTGISNLIKIKVEKDTIYFMAENIDYNKKGCEHISCVSNEEITIGLNGSKLIQCLNSISSEKCIVEMSDASRPVLFLNKNEEIDEIILLMPMMLN